MSNSLLRRILLTGGGGMLGQNIKSVFENNFCELYAPDKKELDLTSSEAFRKMLGKFKPHIIIHAAAKVGGMHKQMENPYEFLIENMNMSANVISAAFDFHVPTLINISSAQIYPENAEGPLSIKHLLQGPLYKGTEAYGLAKISALKLCSYIDNMGENFNYKTIIPTNLYGKYDHFFSKEAHFIPTLIREIHLAKEEGHRPVVIWNKGEMRRDLLYALDLAKFIKFSLNNISLIPSQVNIASGENYMIKEYYKMIGEIVGFKGHFTYDMERPAGGPMKRLDLRPMRELGFIDFSSLKEGLVATYDFYQNMILKKSDLLKAV